MRESWWRQQDAKALARARERGRIDPEPEDYIPEWCMVLGGCLIAAMFVAWIVLSFV